MIHYNPKTRTQEERSSSIHFPERILPKEGREKTILEYLRELALKVQAEYDAKTHQQEVGDGIYQLLY